MATTQTLRNWYPELVPHGTDAFWNVTGALNCDYSICEKVTFYAGGPSYPADMVYLKVHPATKEAFTALASVFRRWGYAFRESAGGTTVCRQITGGRKTSLHAHGVALDINPSKNQYRRTALRGLIQWGIQTDMPKSMIEAVEAIKTKNGQKVFEWGGRWFTIKDPMHFQIRISKADLATGIDWDTVKGLGENPMASITVKQLQHVLNLAKQTDYEGKPLKEDDIWGRRTESAWVKGLSGGGAHSHTATTTIQ